MLCDRKFLRGKDGALVLSLLLALAFALLFGLNRLLAGELFAEFLNLGVEVDLLQQLDRDAVGRIVGIELAQLTARMEGMGYALSVTDDAKSFLADKGYSREYGARPLKRAIQTYVEDKLAEVMIDGECPVGSLLKVDANADKTDLAVTVGGK